ncbi:MAG: hypothetical protein QMD04_06255 [Anaerolineales bacterium]|nr:hypothetical protein [Anaerolineales bacterium]
MKRILLAAIALLLAIIACGRPTPPPPTLSPQPSTLSHLPSAIRQFTISIEYAIPGVAEAYAPTGVTYAKPQPIFGMWSLIEPQPGQYNWKPLDDLVIEYQSAGFSGIQLLITAESPWASVNPPSLLNPGNTFPKEEHRDTYAAFVSRFVERYDGDGMDDAPGLLYPVHHYGIEREFTGFWPGSAKDYVRLLRAAYPAIHAADPQARVLLVALLVGDVFDDNPPEAEAQRRLTQTQPFRKSYAEIKTILAACDAYDIVDFHSLGDYTEIPPTAAWIRDELASLGCKQKPIWIGDSFSMSPLVGFDGRPFHPATDATREQVTAVLKTIADPKNPDYAANLAWLRAEMARGLVKKAVVSAGEGILGINLGNLEDWKTNIPALDAAAVPAVGASMFMGMMDTKLTSRATGPRLPNVSKAGEARPPFYAIKLVNEKIKYFTSLDKLDLAAGVWVYRFETPSGPVWALWYNDGKLYLPGEKPPAISVELPFDAASALITRTPTEAGQSQPETQTLEAADGVLTLILDSTPVFVQPAP